MLEKLLKKDTIRLNVKVDGWKEAIKIGGGLLEKTGAVENSYITAMIDAVEKIGPYIVVAPGIAMPHAKPEKGAKEIGISLITLKEPVEFGHEKNDPVEIVACLSAADQSSHLDILSELVDFLGNENNVHIIKTTDKIDQILDIIN